MKNRETNEGMSGAPRDEYDDEYDVLIAEYDRRRAHNQVVLEFCLFALVILLVIFAVAVTA